MLDSLYNLLLSALGSIISFLPNSPFQAVNNANVDQFLGTLNWFLPISEIIAILQAWLVCVVVFYLYQVILRWVKLM